MFRDNFHAIKTALKHQEQRAAELERELESLQGNKGRTEQLRGSKPSSASSDLSRYIGGMMAHNSFTGEMP